MWTRDEHHHQHRHEDRHEHRHEDRHLDRSPEHHASNYGRRTEQWDPWREQQARQYDSRYDREAQSRYLGDRDRDYDRDADRERVRVFRADEHRWQPEHAPSSGRAFDERAQRHYGDVELRHNERELRDQWEGPRRWDGTPMLPADDRRWDGAPLPPEGEHYGKGPKGWQRSDDRIKDDVSEQLSRHPHLDASGIEVECRECEVVLTGVVQRRADKRLAENVAVAVFGVWDVQNGLRVGQEDTWEGRSGTSVRSQPDDARDADRSEGNRPSRSARSSRTPQQERQGSLR